MNPDLKNLPEKIRDLILSEELMDTTEKLAESHGLRPEYYGALFRNTVNVLKGKLEAKYFVGKLVYELDTNDETAMTIAQEINRDVFTSVREELKQLHGLAPAPLAQVPSAPSAIEQKTGPSSYATPETVVAPVASQAMQNISTTPTQRVNSPVAPSPLMASLNMATMKAATPVVPPALVAPVSPAPKVETTTEMHTITMDPEKMPIAPRPITPVATQTPNPPMASMNIFEEKLGTTFRMKSDKSDALSDYTGKAPPTVPPAAMPTPPVVPFAPAPKPVIPVPSVRPAIAQPVSGVVPAPVPLTPQKPVVPTPVALADSYRESL